MNSSAPTPVFSSRLGLSAFFLMGMCCFITFFVNSEALPSDIMEARNIVTAREMVRDHTWLVPTMNGELRLEKPPLPTWIGGAMELLVPGSLAAQRFPAAVAGTLWTLFLFLTVRRMFRNDVAIVTVITFLTQYNVVLMGRSATWDIYCHAFMMGALWCMVRLAYDPPGKRWVWSTGMGVFMGLSFLSKGPVAFYALLLPFVSALFLYRSISIKPLLRSLLWASFIGILLGGAYYAWLYGFHAEDLHRVAAKESGAWVARNVRPWYYYWRFFLESGIWAPFVLGSIAIPFQKNRFPKSYTFPVAWMLLQLLLLSLLPEKKMRYLLPMAPAMAWCSAMIITWLIAHTRHGKAVRVLMWSVLGLFLGAELFLLRPIGALFGNPESHSIALVKTRKDVAALPFYHNKKEELRIELVYAADRKILPLDLNDSAAVMRAVPFALVSQASPDSLFAPQLKKQLKIRIVDTYDDNKHPKGNKHYTKLFLNHLSVVQAK